jgi:hypothetical protein
MDRANPFLEVYLFGSHARGEARPDSDVDLCIVADGAQDQTETGNRYYSSLWEVWPRPALTLIPITPQRLKEKNKIGDHFFRTIMKEGMLIATQD